jgi:hypothetical protein
MLQLMSDFGVWVIPNDFLVGLLFQPV